MDYGNNRKNKKVATHLPVPLWWVRKEKNGARTRPGSRRTLQTLPAETPAQGPARPIRHIDLFSGIGGFSLAADRVFGNVEHIFCDTEPFAQAVIEKHWPRARIFGDIRTLTADTKGRRFEGRKVPVRPGGSHETPSDFIGCDLLTGGFPCQPFSQAGRRKGTSDDRYLWPEMLRVIREFKPRWVIAENVGGLVTWNDGMVLETVCSDLEKEGYQVQPFIVPAAAVGAPHRRDRVWIIANGIGQRRREGIKSELETDTTKRSASSTKSTRSDSHPSDTALDPLERHQQRIEATGHRWLGRGAWSDERPNWKRDWAEIAAGLCRVDDGVPRRMDRSARLKALGNAIVPQVAEFIMTGIKETDI